MQTMVDVTHENLLRLPASFAPDLIALYITGTSGIVATPADLARFPRSGKVLIDQGFGDTTAHVLACNVEDSEPNAVTPAQVAQDVRVRIAHGIAWTTAYGDDEYLSAIQVQLMALERYYGHGWYWGHVDCWLANWNLSQQQASAVVGTLVHGMTCRAVQWASPGSNPNTILPGTSLTLSQAKCDLSVAQDGWHSLQAPSPQPAPHLVSVTALASMSDGTSRTYTIK